MMRVVCQVVLDPNWRIESSNGPHVSADPHLARKVARQCAGHEDPPIQRTINEDPPRRQHVSAPHADLSFQISQDVDGAAELCW